MDDIMWAFVFLLGWAGLCAFAVWGMVRQHRRYLATLREIDEEEEDGPLR